MWILAGLCIALFFLWVATCFYAASELLKEENNTKMWKDNYNRQRLLGSQHTAKYYKMCNEVHKLNKGIWRLKRKYDRTDKMNNWTSVKAFQETSFEGYCYIVYKGKTLLAYHDHYGFFRFSMHSSNCYMAECITKVMPLEFPDA